MSKRNDGTSDEIEIYKNKIKKYKKLIDEAVSSFSEDNSGERRKTDQDSDTDDQSGAISSDDENNLNTINVDLASVESQRTNAREVLTPKLSDEARQLLGIEKRQQKDQAFKFHPELAECWRGIITDGMESKTKKELEDKYPNKGNCPLRAPELNAELLPLLHKTAKNRDKYLSASQELCGPGLVALGKSICAIFNDEKEPIHKDILLDWMCDASSMFCEVMFQLARTRKYHVYQHVEEKLKSVLQESTTDEFLFGEDLGERIKVASAVEKVGLTLKTPAEKKFTLKPRHLNWKSSSTPRGGHSQTSYNQYNQYSQRPYPKFAHSKRGHYQGPKTQGQQNQPINAGNTNNK